jgi:hypothetical protein
MANFTPGPWSIRVDGTNTGRGPEVFKDQPYYDDDSELIIAECGTTEIRDGLYSGGSHKWKRTDDADIKDANANLIAAAPEMYAALKTFVDADSCNPLLIAEFTTMAMEALAKAEGKSNG